MKLLILGIRASIQLLEKHFEKSFLDNPHFEIHFCDITRCIEIQRSYNNLSLNAYQNIRCAEISQFENLNTYIQEKNLTNSTAILIGWQITPPELNKIIFTHRIKLIKVTNLPLGLHSPLQYFKQVFKLPISFFKNRNNIYIVEGIYKKRLFKYQGCKTIMIHSWEYDNYLKRKNNCIPENIKKTVTYIDQNLMAHQDFRDFKIKSLNIKLFFYELNNFFGRLQHEGYEVKIALHPTANINEYQKIFVNTNGIYINSTYELIDKSYAVIGHYSLALNYAILSDKRIGLIAIPKNYSNFLFRRVKSLSKTLETSFLGLDDQIIFSRIKPYVKTKYIKNFIAGNYPDTKSLFSTKISEYLNG